MTEHAKAMVLASFAADSLALGPHGIYDTKLIRQKFGRPEDFPAGTARVIPERNVHVVSKKEGLAAVSLICTHLGCIVGKTEEGYDCPCHGSKFGQAGEIISGPAPRGLRWLEVSLAADGSLVVDARREVPPGTFHRA